MKNTNTRLADFLFEVGTMRKLMRAHRQVLLTDDMSDSIASHSYRVTVIGWVLAKMEGLDPYKVVMMCLLHDLGEIRSGDHNWVHKRYTKVYDEEIRSDQLAHLPFLELAELAAEYEARESHEAIVAKDADLLDQVLLLREYEWQGNREASIWLRGKDGEESTHIKKLNTDSAKALASAVLEQNPSDWWNNLSTSDNR